MQALETFRSTVQQVRTTYDPELANFAWLQYYKSRDDYIVIDRNVAMGVVQPQSREQKFQEEIRKRRDEYTSMNKVKIFCGTWNVNCIVPDVYLREWLSIVEDPPDIYAVAFQVISLRNKEAKNQKTVSNSVLKIICSSFSPNFIFV